MSQSPGPLDRRAVLKDALLRLQEMQGRLDQLEEASREPIAVIGMGCRFPGGANDPDEFWRLLRDGVDAISEVPAERWDVEDFYDPDPDAPGQDRTRCGGFLDDVDAVRRRVLRHLPARGRRAWIPQQRLLLEVAWEALEDAAPVAGAPVRHTARECSWASRAATTSSSWPVVDPRAIDAYHLDRRGAQHRRRPAGLRPGPAGPRPRQSTPPARRRWSRSTSRARACGRRECAPGARRRGEPHPRSRR